MQNYLYYNAQIMTTKNDFYQIDKDDEAIKAFLEEVKLKTMHFPDYHTRLTYLINHGFYEDFYNQYSKNEIDCMVDLVYSYDFRWQSFMSVSKFYKDYAMKTNDKKYYLENYQDRLIVIALFLARGNIHKAVNMARALIMQYYQPATPTFLNAGKKYRGEFVSCFLLQMQDNLNSISFVISKSMFLSKIGGGVAVNVSNLRSKGDPIKKIQNVAKGVVPVLKLLEDGFNYADQMGQRKGAGAAYLNIFHKDILDFLDTKKINADEKSRIQSLSLGITIPNKFIELAKENKPFYVFSPHNIYQEYGVYLDDLNLDEFYDELLNNEKIDKTLLNARDLLTTIAKIQFESGYPYIIFVDNANQQHPLKRIGNIKMSNLCTEIFQIQTNSTINDYHQDDEIGYDISCILGSLNIVNVMESKDIAFAVNTAIDCLTTVSDLTNIKNAPTIAKANQNLHSIGLGAMNLNGFFAKNNIEYESEEAIDFANTFFMMVNFYSIKRSMKIAKEKHETFYEFHKSEYANGNYFKKYLKGDFSPKTATIKTIFNSMHIPNQNDWQSLMADVREYGLYHAYRLAIAPTQSISYIQNATSSVLPVVDLIESRTYANATTYYPMPFMNKDNIKYYKTAYNVDQYKMIDLIATIQQHVDQGISTTLFVTNEYSTRDLIKLYLYAHKKGLKSLYYTRTKNLTIEECISCAI